MKKEENMREIWKTASHYHLIHSVALAASALHLTGRKRNYVCGLFTLGMILFSGSCYLIVVLNEKKPLNYLTPFGGILMTCGWLALALM